MTLDNTVKSIKVTWKDSGSVPISLHEGTISTDMYTDRLQILPPKPKMPEKRRPTGGYSLPGLYCPGAASHVPMQVADSQQDAARLYMLKPGYK